MPGISNKELLNILKRLVQIPTVNPPGKTDEIVNFLISEVFKEEEGFHNEIIASEKGDVELKNLVSKIGNGKEKIVLSGHLDVVPVGDLTQWEHEPFSADIVDDKLFGRGAADMKSGITMLIGAMKNLKEIPEFLEKYTIVFLGTADEEAGMTGALKLVRKRVLKNSILIVIAEPTDMNLAIIEKGILRVNINIRGRSAHGAMPHKGINSIECALKLIPHLHDCIEDKKNEFLGTSTLNVGMIEGGTAMNVVPDKTSLKLDYRFIPEQDPNQIIQNLKNINISPCSLEVRDFVSLPGPQADINHQFVQNLKNISKTDLIGLPCATEAAVYVNKRRPIPYVIFGPGETEIAHVADEHVSLSKLFKSTEFLTEALVKTYLK